MTAMVTQRGGLEAFRKSWLCGDCGGSNSCASRECEDCGQVRGSSAPRTAQSFALNNSGNGSVVNNVLVVGGDMDNGKEYYDIPAQAALEPQYQFRAQAQNDCHCPDPVPPQLTGGQKMLMAGQTAACWTSAIVFGLFLVFFVWLACAGLSQAWRVFPHG